MIRQAVFFLQYKIIFIMFGVPKLFRLGKRMSQAFVILYIAITLYIRMQVEAELEGMWLISLIIGAIFLLVLWAMIKIRILNPGWIGASDRN